MNGLLKREEFFLAAVAAEHTRKRAPKAGMRTWIARQAVRPDHTQRAVRMAVEMRDSIGLLSQKWRNRGHNLGFSVGIAVGYATLGQVGFERRLEYAAIGSVTNLASRLCDEAKAGQIVVSQRAYGMIEACVDAIPLPPLKLKGFHQPIAAVEILSWRDQPAPEGMTAQPRSVAANRSA